MCNSLVMVGTGVSAKQVYDFVILHNLFNIIGFTVDGKLVFRCFGNEFYSDNGIKEYVPLGECWPSVLEDGV